MLESMFSAELENLLLTAGHDLGSVQGTGEPGGSPGTRDLPDFIRREQDPQARRYVHGGCAGGYLQRVVRSG
jgi:hypothetical protein